MDELGEARIELIAPRTKMNACENNFFCAAITRELNIVNHIGNGSASRFATRNGGDAKCALIVATVLRFDEGARAAMKTGEGNAGQRFKVEGLQVKGIFNKALFAIIRNDARDIW